MSSGFFDIRTGVTAASLKRYARISAKKNAELVLEHTKAEFERAFPGRVDPKFFADALLERFRKYPEGTRSQKFESIIRQVIFLEHTAMLCGKAVTADEFGEAKRIFASHVLSIVYEKLGDLEFRKSKLADWSEWLLAKSMTDVRDFSFWNRWHDRFVYESVLLLPGEFPEITP